MNEWAEQRKKDEKEKIENLREIMKRDKNEVFKVLLKSAEREYEKIGEIEEGKIKCRNVFMIEGEEKEEEKMTGDEIFNEIIKLRKMEREGYEDYKLFDVDYFVRKYGINGEERPDIEKIGKRYFMKNEGD